MNSRRNCYVKIDFCVLKSKIGWEFRLFSSTNELFCLAIFSSCIGLFSVVDCIIEVGTIISSKSTQPSYYRFVFLVPS